MEHSGITVVEAIKGLKEPFFPIKITFNGIVLYNDYEDDEAVSVLEAVEGRLQHFENYSVTSMNIEVVGFHHSIVNLFGERKKDN